MSMLSAEESSSAQVCSNDNEFFDQLDGRCHDCETVWASWRLLMLCVLGAVTVASIIGALALRACLRLDSCWHAALAWDQVACRLQSAWRQQGMQTKGKIFFALYQVVAAIPSLYSGIWDVWNNKYTQWVRALQWPSFVSIDFLVPPECIFLGHAARLVVSAVWPWALILSVALLSALRARTQHVSSGGQLRSVCAHVAARVVPLTLILT